MAALHECHSKTQTRLGEKTGSLQSSRPRSSRTGQRVAAVHAGPAARLSTVVVAVHSLLPNKTRSLQENLKNSWPMDHPSEQCTKALGDNMCSAALEVSLDTLHRSVRAGLNGNKHAMVPTRQGIVLTADAAAVVDASAATAADAADGAAWNPLLLMMMNEGL